MNVHEMMFPNPIGGPAAIMPAPGMMTNMNMGASGMAPMGGMGGGMPPMGGGMPPMGGGMPPMGGGMPPMGGMNNMNMGAGGF